MSTTTTTAGQDEAGRLRQRMVDDLAESGLPGGVPYSAAVLAEMRRVFVADASPADAYGVGNAVVLGRRDEQGLAITSASAPSVVALMLTQLNARGFARSRTSRPRNRREESEMPPCGARVRACSPQPFASALWRSSPSRVSYVE